MRKQMAIVSSFSRRLISLRTGLVVLVLVALLPAVILVVLSGLNRREADQKRAAEDSIRFAQLISSQYMETRQSALQTLTVLATLDSVREPARCSQELASLRQRFPQYVGFAYADASGTVTCSSTPPEPGLPPESVADRNYFVQAMARNTFSEGEFRFNERTQKPTIAFAYPIRDDDGQPAGTVIASLDLTWFNVVLSLEDIPRDMTVTLFDRNGTVLSRYPDPRNRWVGQQYGESGLFKRISTGEAASFQTEGLDSVNRLYAFTNLGPGESAALLTVGTPANLAFAEANAALTRSLRILFVVALIAAFAAWTLGEIFILGPIQALARVSRRLALGDLDARSDLHMARGEVGHLQRTFNDMALALQLRNGDVINAERALRSRIAQLNALQGVFSRITEVLSTEDVIDSALEQASSLINSDVVVLRLVNNGVLEVAGTYSSGDTELDMSPIPKGQGPIARVVEHAEVVRFEKATEEGAAQWQGVRSAQSGIAVPILIHGEVLGTFSCWSMQPNAFSEDDEQLIQMFATQIGAAIAAARARDDSERRARRDSLTGLPNRLQLTEDSLKLEADKVRQPKLIAMVDIDHFKHVNDQFGHMFGDAVLKRVASILQEAVKRGDIVYRFGGEEFLVLAGCRDIVDGAALAEALREAVASVNFEQRRDRPPLRVTVSAGVGVFEAGSASLASVIELADQALYRAKANGRNRVELADDLEAEEYKAA
jgi:diguanylate cyclase (GGDEF)-like protein